MQYQNRYTILYIHISNEGNNYTYIRFDARRNEGI